MRAYLELRDVCINIWKIKGQIKAAHSQPESVINRNRNDDEMNSNKETNSYEDE